MRRRVVALSVTFGLLQVALSMVAAEMTPPLRHHDWITQHQDETIHAFADESGCTDVAIIGSSLAHMGLEPTRIEDTLGSGVRVVNASTPGSFISIDAAWYRRFVAPTLDPSMLVYVVGQKSFSPSTAEGEALAESFAEAPATASGAWADVGRVLADILPAYAARQRLADPAEWLGLAGRPLPYNQLPFEDVGWILPSGYWAVTAVGDHRAAFALIGALEPGQDLSIFAGNTKRPVVEPAQVAELESFVQEVQSSGVEMVLVLPPAIPQTRAFLMDGLDQYDTYRNEVRRIAAATESTLIDASDLAIPPEWFSDAVHLNVDGARQLSDFVGSGLAEADLVDPCAVGRGALPASRTIAVVGDATASLLALQLRAMRRDLDIRVLDDSTSVECGVLRAGTRRDLQVETPIPPRCNDLVDRWRDVADDADVVVAAFCSADLPDRAPPGTANFVGPGAPKWNSAYRAAIGEALAALGGGATPVVWLTCPVPEPAPGHPFPVLGAAGDAARVQRLDEQLVASLQGRPNVVVLDVNHWFDDRPTTVPPERIAGARVTSVGAGALVEALLPYIRERPAP